MQSRNEFAQLLTRMGLTGVAAEIGVAEGGFSFHLLDNWPGVCYQIDPWKWQSTPGYSEHGTHDQDGRYLEVCRIASRYNGRARPMRTISSEAAKQFPDEFFDFVYIDAIHTLESSREDIALWYPKVKHGGVLAGHDYLVGVFQGQDYGVKTAVDEFAAANNLTVSVIQEEWPSWWIVKP